MPKNVKVYALSTCVHCRNAREFLDRRGIAYECVEVDKLEGDERKEMLDEVKRHNANCTFPTILIGERVIVGFQREEIEEALKS
ncbi:glutaredoxin family protein [Desulfoglaeba alkanexedens]|uniref:Glutaredoxin family protein n=1 Tax=Desulfoglaeba alkanexedens ALDC TaxID=980445 RepID=A0A4P8L2I5_9BACT|nr:glutaredoxin family protein [Desulfoglaeba alkanexedens]QCQ21165.1 glutaredoxin family protein [Desulfoglaeba alkanexedens ALDC]